jgi:hypothetical protein
MAARRLLIVMLVLLGLSTLAAALIPQSGPREGETTESTTQPTTTTTAARPAPAYVPPTKITVGGKKFPIVSPVHVGDQFTLLVRSRVPAEIEIPEFGQLAFAAPNSPARFELLASAPGTFGVLFASTGKVAAQIRVVPPGKKRGKPRKPKKPKRRARAGSGPA